MLVAALIIGTVFLVFAKPFQHKDFKDEAIEVVEDLKEVIEIAEVVE